MATKKMKRKLAVVAIVAIIALLAGVLTPLLVVIFN